MAKITVDIHIEQTKPKMDGTNFDEIKTWIKTNVTDKLPENATALYNLHYTP